MEQAKFTFFPLGKTSAKQAKQQVHSLKSLNLSNKTNELK